MGQMGQLPRAPTNSTNLGGPTTRTTKLTCSELLIIQCDNYRPMKRRLNLNLYESDSLLIWCFVPWKFMCLKFSLIPEQFTAIGPPSFIWRGGRRGKKNWGGTLSRGFGLRSFRPVIPPEISAWGVFFGRRFTVKAHSTNSTYTNTNTNTDLPILKILRFVNFGRKLLRPKPLESVSTIF